MIDLLRYCRYAVVAVLAPAAALWAEEPLRAGAEAPRSARAVQRKLLSRADVEADKVPLQDLLTRLSKEHDVPIRLDDEGLKRAGVVANAPVSVSLRNVTLNAALQTILGDLKLQFSAGDDGLVVSDRVAAPENAGGNRPVLKEIVAEAFGAIVGNPVRNAQQEDALAEQYVQFLRPAFRSELGYVRNVCNVTHDQMRELRAKEGPSLKSASKKFVRAQQGNNRRRSGGMKTPQQIVEAEVAELVQELLAPAQVDLYRQEREKRGAARKRTAVRTLVARLDRELMLSSEQRDRLCDVLLAQWDEAWGDTTNSWMMNSAYPFPQIPEKPVIEILTDSQQKAWRNLPKNNVVNFGFNFGFFNALGIAEDDDENAQPAEVEQGDANVERNKS